MDLFTSDEEFVEFLSFLAKVKSGSGFYLLAYTLMTNHFHLLLEVHDRNLSGIMHDLLGPYSRWFNCRRGRRGHVFEGRHKEKLCREDRYLSQVIPYIHNNPVRAGLVEDPADWPWSSHHQFISAPRSVLLDEGRTLSLLGQTPEEGKKRYHEIMNGPGSLDSPVFDEYSSPIEARRTPPSPAPLRSIESDIERETGWRVSAHSSQQRCRPLTAARRAFACQAAASLYPLREVARFLNLSPGAVFKLLHSTTS